MRGVIGTPHALQHLFFPSCVVFSFLSCCLCAPPPPGLSADLIPLGSPPLVPSCLEGTPGPLLTQPPGAYCLGLTSLPPAGPGPFSWADRSASLALGKSHFIIGLTPSSTLTLENQAKKAGPRAEHQLHKAPQPVGL